MSTKSSLTLLLKFRDEYASNASVDVCIHAAESGAEKRMMLTGDGPFVDGLAKRRIEWRAPQTSTIKYLASLGGLKGSPLLVHCVRADEDDIAEMSRHGVRVVQCPKSNAKLGTGLRRSLRC